MAVVETLLALLGVVVVLFVAAVLSTREGPVLADAPQDAADLALPEGPLQPEDVTGLRFGMAPRGYRMSEVDTVLDRLAAELADRDRRLALLEATIEGRTPSEPAPASAPAEPVEATPEDLPLPEPVAAVPPGTAAAAPAASDAPAPVAAPPVTAPPVVAPIPVAPVLPPVTVQHVPDAPPAGPPPSVAEVPVEPAPEPATASGDSWFDADGRYVGPPAAAGEPADRPAGGTSPGA